MNDIDYGPLADLPGCWRGDSGQDRSPEPDGVEENAYTETIRFTAAGDVDNAETQELAFIHYWLEVHRIRDGKSIHHQTGYWIWDAEAETVIHGFCIPRAVSVIAAGRYRGETDADGNRIIEVSASADSADWRIIESPFMRERATTRSFQQTLITGADSLAYRQTTLVDIYDYDSFRHTDENRLQRVPDSG